MQNDKKITTRKEDFSLWYQDVIQAADLAEHSPVKGCMVIKPTGYAIWENIEKILDEKIKEYNVENTYFPLFIPENFINREKEHVKGFAPEVAVVTHAGGKELKEPLIVRPTSETIMYETFSKWISSYRDLPLLINQWANVVRWELRPRLFLRTVEFLWQEGHTVHQSEKEADEFAKKMLNMYEDFAENYLAIPVIKGTKTEKEKFAGAEVTYTAEAMMQDGKALQTGTSHNLGQNFAKTFNIKYLDIDNKEKFAWQTSWGVSTRLIGALIMAHSDDSGLVLPPKIAPIQSVITCIYKNDDEKVKVVKYAEKIKNGLEKTGIRTKIDDRDIRFGEKLYYWEKKGVPVRVEVGPRDVDNGMIIYRRDDLTKKPYQKSVEVCVETIGKLLNEIQNNLYNRALEFQKKNTVEVDTLDEFKKAINDGKFVYAHWCGDTKVEEKIQEEFGATIRCISFDQKKEIGKCIYSGKESAGRVLFAKAY
jgi:prolyl-tRNA synthetase